MFLFFVFSAACFLQYLPFTSVAFYPFFLILGTFSCTAHRQRPDTRSSVWMFPYVRVHTPVVMAMPGEKAQALNETTLFRGTLPREPVCTENLTPLIKMLPCRSQVS